MSILNTLIPEAIKPLPQSVIDRCTVWTTCLHNDGRYYAYKYEAHDKQLLIEYAESKRASIDLMRSPSLSRPALQADGLWAIKFTYYGLD